MKHRETKQSVLIRTGLYSSTIFELEVWTLANDSGFSDEEFEEQIKRSSCMDCGLRREMVGLFPTKDCALEHLEMMYEDPFPNDRELYCAFIREKAMHCMMQPNDYIKEWTYVHGLLHDESLVRNYAEDENPFGGRPKEMVRFKKGDIVMIPNKYDGHWGIVYETPITPEDIKELNERNEKKTGVRVNNYSHLDWSDDQYTILVNCEDGTTSHEHILAHHVLPASHVPEYVQEVLEELLSIFQNRQI